MKYEQAKSLKEGDFKRLDGVKKETFLEMCQIIEQVENEKTSGRKSGLSAADQLLLTLNYWREYRTRVSFGTRFRLARIKCLAGDSESRKHFNQVREVCTAGQKAIAIPIRKWIAKI